MVSCGNRKANATHYRVQQSRMPHAFRDTVVARQKEADRQAVSEPQLLKALVDLNIPRNQFGSDPRHIARH